MSGKSGGRKLDLSVLSAEQQAKLRQFKIKTRIDNEQYLISHPEVQQLIGDFLRDVLLERPADIHKFAVDHFTNPNLPVVTGSKTQINSNME
ncbi:hypothetical protein LDENG_00146880 [Lucifuga dentata]|nr:hypothetical protein LDENG_00146880 [Lucifuga dentata]